MNIDERERAAVAFGERLRAVMERKQISQKDLVHETGKKRSQISMWVSGKRKAGYKNCKILANAIGCTVHELTGEVEPRTRAASDTQRAGGDAVLIKDVGQINNSSFAEKSGQQHKISAADVKNIVEQLKEMQKWQADQQQRVTVTNYNLQLVVEWMDEQYAGDNQVKTINFLQTMMDIFPSFKAFVDRKTGKK